MQSQKKLELPNGETKNLTRHGKTRAAASRSLNEAIEQALKVYTREQTDSTDEIFVDLLVDKQTARGVKPKTIYNNKALYKNHIKPVIGDMPLSSVRLDDFSQTQLKLLLNEPPRYRTAELSQILLGEIYKHALRMYHREITEGRVRLYNLAED